LTSDIHQKNVNTTKARLYLVSLTYTYATVLCHG